MILKNNRKYTLFQLANLISRFGDSLDSIAFGWMVYDITKSALSMSLFFLINVLPNLIFSLPAGVIADRKSNKKLILVGYAGRGLVVLTLSLLLRTLYKKLKQNVGRRAIKRMYGGKHAFFFFLPKS
ncbi:MAG: enterobactin exporter EntS [Spirochaetes bacterium ADurb.Bin110]|nr:MAG: enterobactin exporter EntS [Spirochaetes bacterium ADurb.Bin110]